MNERERDKHGQRGIGYLLCIDPPADKQTEWNGYKHAGHYLGWAKKGDGSDRIRRHMNGTSGAKLTEAAVATGCRLFVGRIFHDITRADERRMHNAGNASRLCLRCRRRKQLLRQDHQLVWLLAQSIRRAAKAKAKR